MLALLVAAAPAIPNDVGGKYVAGAYIVFVLLLLIYVAIMGMKLARIESGLREVAEIAEQRKDDAAAAAGEPAAPAEPAAEEPKLSPIVGTLQGTAPQTAAPTPKPFVPQEPVAETQPAPDQGAQQATAPQPAATGSVDAGWDAFGRGGERTQILEDLDLNAVPPVGITGIEITDKAKERDGVICYGAIGVGGTKMKIHRAAIERLFTANNLVLDAEEVFQIGQEL